MTAGTAPGRAAGPARTIFFGSGSFAVPILDAVAAHPRLELVAVVTAADKPAGRARALTATPVAIRARSLGAPVLQPAGVRSSAVLEELAALQPDLGVLADYGRIIPQALLDLPRLGILGVHPSLLPRHRGATPIQATILAGDAEAAVAVYRMDAGLDTGPVLATTRWALEATERAPELEAEAARRGAALLAANIAAYIDGTASAQPQADEPASVTTRFTRDHARLDPSQPAAQLERQVRAHAGWPGSFIETRAGRLGVLRASVAAGGGGTVGASPGELVEAPDRQPAFVAGDRNLLVLERVQPAGGREMAGADYLRGHRELLGTTVASAATVSER
ncbi:MAG TPA: methionyl-tRNA formyltransferase [Candidatus Limnocylindrales bacterium]|nr:methionyl-tRNA formyltransferase [Candidatus Limnocylindrales bacterium]